MSKFEYEIKIINTYDDLFSYPTYIQPMNDFNKRFEEMRNRKNILENEENILFGFKSLYESYFRFEKFFEPHYQLWTSSETFIEKIRKFGDALQQAK